MDEEAMDIDEPVPNAQIIERKPPLLPAAAETQTSDIVVIDADEPVGVEAAATVAPIDNKKDEIVVLDDEEDDVTPTQPCDVIDLVGKKSCNTKCINYACSSGKDMLEAPGLCLQYFRVKNSTENKRREVCRECYILAMEHYDALANALIKGDNIFSVKFPLRNDMFEIDDSDSENENEPEEYFDDDCVEYLEKEINQVLEETINKYDLNKQSEEGVKYLKEKSQPLAEDFKRIDEELRGLRKKLDSVQLNLYKQFPINFKEEAAIDILENGVVHTTTITAKQPERRSLRNVTHKVNYCIDDDDAVATRTNSAATAAVVSKEKVDEQAVVMGMAQRPADLPPTGKLTRDTIVIGDFYYASRLTSRGSWVKVKLLDIIREERPSLNQQTAKIMYKVRVEDKNFNHYVVEGREIAYMQPAKVKLEVGTRVIAKFDFTNSVVPNRGPLPSNAMKKVSYYPGIVGEPPYAANRYRYLVFFDDGYAQYVDHKNIFVTFKASDNVWEDINEQNRDFIRKYLQTYPERSMVKLMRRQTIQVEYNGKCSAFVKQLIN